MLILATLSPPGVAQEEEDDASELQPGENVRRVLYRFTRVRSPGLLERNHLDVRTAFREVVKDPVLYTVRIVCDQDPAALGVIVDADGLIATKFSEMSGKIECILTDKRRLAAKIVARHLDSDLALLKIDAHDLPTVTWSLTSPPVGSWLATPGLEAEPISIGIVSVAPRQIAAARPILGVELKTGDKGAQVLKVLPGSGADRAGLRPDDIIRLLDGESVKDHESVVQLIRKMHPGNRVRMMVDRDGKDLPIQAVLGDTISLEQGERAMFQNNLGGPLSRRRTGFPSVLQHDSVLRPHHCGGAIVDLDGKAVGLNIARAGRVESYALPASLIVPLIDEMRKAHVGQSLAAKSR